MKNLKYGLILLLSMLCSIWPLLIAAIVIILYMNTNEMLVIYIGVPVGLIGFLFKEPIRQLRVKYRQEVEYDEFGLSKKNGKYEYLSQEQREAIDLQKTADMERLLNTTALKKMTQHGPKEPMKELDEMIGLEPVKETVKEMVARMKFETEENKKKKKKDQVKLSGRHMVFFGSPGTGKTTVARIITSFLHQYGYIKENKCIEIDGNFLKAGTESALKTELVIRQAYGGVLFIDEAYALMEGGSSGAQAIATLIKQMEDNRDKFILILAGYTHEMKELINQNPGFESRLKEYLNFPDYDAKEMREILSYMANKNNFTIDEEAYPMYDMVVAKERQLSSFGNGRTARNILDKAIDKHTLNLANGVHDQNSRYILKEIDFKNLKLGGIGSERQYDSFNRF